MKITSMNPNLLTTYSKNMMTPTTLMRSKISTLLPSPRLSRKIRV